MWADIANKNSKIVQLERNKLTGREKKAEGGDEENEEKEKERETEEQNEKKRRQKSKCYWHEKTMCKREDCSFRHPVKVCRKYNQND